MRDYLVALRDLVREGLNGKRQFSDSARQYVLFELVTRFPFHFPGGGFTREELLAGIVQRVARQQADGDTAGPTFKL